MTAPCVRYASTRRWPPHLGHEKPSTANVLRSNPAQSCLGARWLLPKTNDLLLRLEYGREVLTQESIEGDCRGGCTPGEKQEGEERLAAIRERIAKDEGSESELDYNFVDCLSFTPKFLGVLGGFDRPLLFVSTEHLAHHDVVRSEGANVRAGC